MYLVELKAGRVPIGICGLLKRDPLEDVDIGFAFLPKFRARGFAYEAASATMRYARDVLGLKRIVAITMSDNHAAARLLEKLGLRYERMVRLPDDSEDLRLYATTVV